MTQKPFTDPKPEDLSFGLPIRSVDVEDLDLDTLNLLLAQEPPKPRDFPAIKEPEESEEKDSG